MKAPSLKGFIFDLDGVLTDVGMADLILPGVDGVRLKDVLAKLNVPRSD